MAMIREREDNFLRSPNCTVVWCGFEAPARRLQQCGWEFATELSSHPYDMGERLGVTMRHRETGWTGRGQVDGRHLRSAAMRYSNQAMFDRDYSGRGVEPVIEVTHMGTDRDRQYDSRTIFRRIDMTPSLEMTTAAEIGKSLFELDVFRPWKPESKDIIVDPNSVAELFDRIKHLQVADLADIRERNRRREARGAPAQEQVVCQVLSLAA